MATWGDVFTTGSGSDIYTAVFDIRSDLYIAATDSGLPLDLYNQMVRTMPQDIFLVVAIFFSSIFYIVIFFGFMYVMFMPFFHKIAKW